MRVSPTEAGIRVALLFGLPFGTVQAARHESFEVGFVAMLLGGGVVGLIVAARFVRMHRHADALVAQCGSEGIVHHGYATCARGSGYLLLTSRQLLWLPLKAKDNHNRIVISRSAIERAEPSLLDMRIVVATGERVRFRVQDRKTWLARVRDVSTCDTRAPLPDVRVV